MSIAFSISSLDLRDILQVICLFKISLKRLQLVLTLLSVGGFSFLVTVVVNVVMMGKWSKVRFRCDSALRWCFDIPFIMQKSITSGVFLLSVGQ